MGLSVSNQSKYIYDMYKFTTSTTYEENLIDSSSVSSEKYNVSNITNALDSLEKSDSISFDSISNLNSFSKDSYTLSQLASYETLTGPTDTGITRLLSGEAGADDIYDIMKESNLNLVAETESLSGVSAESVYSSYLGSIGNIIDELA